MATFRRYVRLTTEIIRDISELVEYLIVRALAVYGLLELFRLRRG
jgi:hypothetical protein